MEINLFERIDYYNDNLWIVKEALNSVYSLSFPITVKKYLNEIDVCTDFGGCKFLKSDDVYCYCLEDEIIVSKPKFYECLEKACDRFMEIHPQKKDELIIVIADFYFSLLEHRKATPPSIGLAKERFSFLRCSY